MVLIDNASENIKKDMKQIKKTIIFTILLLLIFPNINAQAKNSIAKENKINITTVLINSKTEKCLLAEVAKECLQIKYNKQQANWDILYQKIIGFKYQQGYFYELKIKTEKILSKTQNTSITKMTLIKIVKKKKENIGLSLNNQWIISSFGYNDKIETPNLKNIYITLDEKLNTLSGSGGCNNLMGKFTLEGNKISFGKIASTMMACDNMQQESKFIRALESVTSFKIEGCELFLYKNKTKILTLESCK